VILKQPRQTDSPIETQTQCAQALLLSALHACAAVANRLLPKAVPHRLPSPHPAAM
jgi:hypothetical protein